MRSSRLRGTLGGFGRPTADDSLTITQVDPPIPPGLRPPPPETSGGPVAATSAPVWIRPVMRDSAITLVALAGIGLIAAGVFFPLARLDAQSFPEVGNVAGLLEPSTNHAFSPLSFVVIPLGVTVLLTGILIGSAHSPTWFRRLVGGLVAIVGIVGMVGVRRAGLREQEELLPGVMAHAAEGQVLIIAGLAVLVTLSSLLVLVNGVRGTNDR